jgi:hypothetical protein
MKMLRRYLMFSMILSLALHGQTSGLPAESQQQTGANELSTVDGGGETSGAIPNPALSNGTSKDRLFFTLPNFLTVENASNAPPLTAAQKFQVTARSAFDPVNFAWFGLLAGISQAQNSEPGYRQGWTGYGKRYAAYLGDGVIENFSTQAVLPALLHQDPRFFQSGQGGFWRRTGYAVSRIFVTRSDTGKTEFNYSEILGSAAASGISTYTYHPKGDRNLANTASVWGSQVGYDALTDVIKEFWPDIRRKMNKVNKSL